VVNVEFDIKWRNFSTISEIEFFFGKYKNVPKSEFFLSGDNFRFRRHIRLKTGLSCRITPKLSYES